MSSPLQIFAVWQLYVGGIKDPDDISELLGLSINRVTLGRYVAKVEEGLYGPLRLKKLVRCLECGGLLTAVPCGFCGKPVVMPKGYKIIT